MVRDLDRQILKLALPVLATLAADPLYELTDTAILGHLGTAELGGAAIGIVLLGLVQAVFIFLMFGTTAMVARLIGADRHAEAASAGIQALWLATGIGVSVALMVWPLAPTLVGWFGGDGEVAAAAELYFRVSLLGLPAFLLVMAAVGYLRGCHDTTTPLFVALGTVALNLVIEVVAIYGLGFGVGASALGTVVAKWTGAIILIGFVLRDAHRLHVSRRPRPAQLRGLSTTAVPLFVRTVFLRGVITIAAAVAARLGDISLAGYAIAFQVWMTLTYLVDGLEVAGQVLVGNALGAGDVPGARLVGRRTLMWSTVLGAVAGFVVWVLRTPIADVFTDDPEVIAIAVSSLVWVAAMQPVCAAAFALDGVMVGAGDLWYLAWVMVAASLVFVPVAWLLVLPSDSIGWLWAALAGFMALRGAAMWLRFTGSRWSRPGAELRVAM